MSTRQFGERVQIVGRQQTAGRIIRRVDDDHARPRRYQRPHLIPVRPVVGKAKMGGYGPAADRFDRRQMEREIRDIKKILDLAMPASWEHLTPPSLAEIRAEVQTLAQYMDPDLVYIARAGEDPIGFVVALPDYNQVMKKLNGRLLPFGWLKYLWYRRKITGARVFIQFVVPKYRNKAVNGAVFHRLMLEARRKGYTYGEGSAIAEMNLESIRSVEGAGGRLYRIYRIYQKEI